MRKLCTWITAIALALFCLPAEKTQAMTPHISIPQGTTTVFSAPDGVARIVIGDSSIADVTSAAGQNKEILIIAKKQGFTNFIVWPLHGSPRPYYLEVLPPGRRETILVRIRVLEVAKGNVDKLGINFNESVDIAEAPPSSALRIGLPIRESYLKATINMLTTEKKAKVLAEPTLLCSNNATASFLSGGEVPIPLITQNSVTVEWKKFGVQLSMQPTVQEADTIIMKLRPEVSSLDNQSGIELTNLKVPGVATRFAETTVTLQSGQSIVIAGLAKEEERTNATKIPILGEIPVLGQFFRTTALERTQSELVFIVTPALVEPNSTIKPEADYGQMK